MTVCECDVCDTEIQFEEWTNEVVVCPKCGARYEADAEYSDAESSSWVFWLRRIEDAQTKD